MVLVYILLDFFSGVELSTDVHIHIALHVSDHLGSIAAVQGLQCVQSLYSKLTHLPLLPSK